MQARLAGAAQPNVDLYTISPLTERQPHRRQAVLRRTLPRSTMAVYQRRHETLC
jgi:hypothetical protein